jgi:hypothetical protein
MRMSVSLECGTPMLMLYSINKMQDSLASNLCAQRHYLVWFHIKYLWTHQVLINLTQTICWVDYKDETNIFTFKNWQNLKIIGPRNFKIHNVYYTTKHTQLTLNLMQLELHILHNRTYTSELIHLPNRHRQLTVYNLNYATYIKQQHCTGSTPHLRLQNLHCRT